MHPNAFLRTFWRAAWTPAVFVAMSFDSRYEPRFSQVFEPAIRGLSADGCQLDPVRVDSSASGDSILTQIDDGIAHSRLVLADVSTIGRDAVTGKPFRNGNVLYEVGVALACRRPEDVLLIRDDHDPFLFDVSTVPHATLDFTDVESSRDELGALLAARLDEQQFTFDARVERAMSSLSIEEVYILRPLQERPPDHVFFVTSDSVLRRTSGVQRLLDQGLLRLAATNPGGDPGYRLTPVGIIVAKRLAEHA